MINGYVEMDYWPIFNLSEGTNFKTNSVFVNDTWRLSNAVTLNLGLRYDKNDGKNSLGQTVANDSAVSPRLGASWEINDSWLLQASYGRYVNAVANNVADRSGGGVPSWFGYQYMGPAINAECDADGANCTFVPQYTSFQAIAKMFEWFESEGGAGQHQPVVRLAADTRRERDREGPQVPVRRRVHRRRDQAAGHQGHGPRRLRPPHVRGFLRPRSEISPRAPSRRPSTSPRALQITQEFDKGYVVNDDKLLSRKYDGLHMQFDYRWTDKFNLGGNYTLSRTHGNWDGENSGSGPITSGVLDLPRVPRREVVRARG